MQYTALNSLPEVIMVRKSSHHICRIILSHQNAKPHTDGTLGCGWRNDGLGLSSSVSLHENHHSGYAHLGLLGNSI
jgi:hypothetical protein